MKTAITSTKFWIALGASVIFGLGVAVRAAGTPSLLIVTPAVNDNVSGSNVAVKMEVTDFNLVDYQTNSKRMSGQGHIHLWLDQTAPTKTSAIKLYQDNYTFTDVKEGSHTLVAELVNNDHSSLVPPVVSTVTFATSPEMSSTSELYQSPTFMLSILAFIMLVIALYFVNTQIKATPHSGKQFRKSSPKSSKKK